MGQTCAKNERQRSFLKSPKSRSSSVCIEARRSSAFNLCHHEVAIIRRSWDVAKSKDIGLRIVVSILIKRPRFSTYFGIQSGMAPEELRAAPAIISHGLRMTAFLENVICAVNILDENYIRQLIQRIGMAHFHKGVNFNADNWLLFKRVLLEELCRHDENMPRTREQKRKELEDAWGKLLRFVISEMKRGFLEEALKTGESDSSN